MSSPHALRCEPRSASSDGAASLVVVRVAGGSKDALVAAATRACEQQTAAPSCERVLVVYGERAANLYIESTPSRPAVVRRTA